MTALKPELTRFDVRVLNALAVWPDQPMPTHLDFRTAWQVAERLGEYDVALVRDTLRGLTHLGYAISRKWGTRQQWVQAWRIADKVAWKVSAACSPEQSSDVSTADASASAPERTDPESPA